MPATRLANRRRRSSHAIFTPARAGKYGVSTSNSAYSTPSPAPPPYSQLPIHAHAVQRPVTFAPNVTPVTFNEEDSEDDTLASLAASTNPNVQALTAKLFPPSATPAPPPQRKRCPPGKRLSQGYIPRPPNAFMLFRADFVRQKHVPGSIETDHGSLSKIIGTCWRQLPLEEKRVWEVKAKQEKAAHKAKYPDYRFRPVHNKKKQHAALGSPEYESQNQKPQQTPEEAQRCDDLAQLLLEGKKGEDLARAVRDLERQRARGVDHNEYPEYDNGFGNPGLDRRQHFNLTNFAMPMPLPASSSSSLLQVPFTAPFGYGSQNPHHHHAAYHRRSSSVPLPNEWLAFNNVQGNQLNQNHGAGIALPSIPPFGSSSTLNHRDEQHQFDQAPDEENDMFEQFTNPFLTQYTASAAANENPHHHHQHQNQSQSQNDSLHHPNVPNPNFQSPLFAPQPQFPGLSSSFFNNHVSNNSTTNGMNITPRSSYGHRRASSAQPILRRSWTMDETFGYGFQNSNGMMERDPEPLPEVNAEFFPSDFSFTSPSVLGGNGGGGGGRGASVGLGSALDERGLPSSSLSSASTVVGADLDLVDPATPLNAIHPRVQPPHHSHSHSNSHSHSHSHTHSHSQSLSGIDTALAGVSFSNSASAIYSTSSVSMSASPSSSAIQSSAPSSFYDASDALAHPSGGIDPHSTYDMATYVQYGQQQQSDELAGVYGSSSAASGPENSVGATGMNNNNNNSDMGGGDNGGVDSYPSPFGSPYDLPYQQQQHLRVGMPTSAADLDGGASGVDDNAMYQHASNGYGADPAAQEHHAEEYFEYNMGVSKVQHQAQMGMGLRLGVGGGYYNGVSA